MISKKPFTDITDALKEAGNYRVFNDVLREAGNYPKTIWYSKYGIKNVINWCANDYLGMAQHKVVLDAMHTALDAAGAGSGGTRNISGTTHYHVALEMEIAKWHKMESALIHTSAFVANEWTLISLTKIINDIEFVTDDNNHASLVQGILKSKAKKHLWKHNDMQDLEDKLKAVKGTPCLVFESVYSMEGDVAPLKEILDLADKYKAITYIDEVHAVGLYGETGAGWLEKIGLQDRVDLVSGSFSKAVGLHGGYIAGDKEIVDAIRSISPGFIFTTSIPPVICAGALASVKYLKDDGGKELRRQHQENAMELKTLLKGYNIEVYPNETHLVPVMVRDSVKCKKISDTLLYDHDIYVQPINYPTVAKGTERLRFAPTPMHTDAMISDLADKLNEVYHD